MKTEAEEVVADSADAADQAALTALQNSQVVETLNMYARYSYK